jgi:glycosyltransferase involved in cell wall biosynthesis
MNRLCADASPRAAEGLTASPAGNRSVEAVVCVPTFRRPRLLIETLKSLAGQRCRTSFAVVVVENDSVKREGEPVANEFFAAGLLAGFCVVEERQGNCHAINRAFREARDRFPTASYFLMIDDDEHADPDWIELMLCAARDHHADVVGGPVFSEFPPGTPASLSRHPIYWPAYARSGFVPMIYGSGNCLISRRAFQAVGNPNFDARFNHLGGGDTDFFTRCRAAGLKSYWQDGARIFETVPKERLQPAWVIRRGLRIGAINFHIERVASPRLFGRVRVIAKTVVLVPVSMWRSVKLAARGKPALVVLHPSFIALGRILAWFGGAPEQYSLKTMQEK